MLPRFLRDAKLALFALLLAPLGCASIPNGTAAIDKVSFQGNDNVSSGDLEDKIATAESAKFLFLFQGVVFDYEIFDPSVLERDLARVERYYRARGYYSAHARAGRVEYRTPKHVRVTVVVDEGEPVKVRDVKLIGTEQLPPDVAKAVVSASTSKFYKGKLFEEDKFEDTDDAIKRAMTDRGYAYAQTSRRAEVDLATHDADAIYEVFPGPNSKLGPVTIEGLGKLPEGPVRRALNLKPGDVYSTQDLDDAKQSVLDLGAFGNVVVEPQLAEPPPKDAVVPIKVRVEPSKLHQLTIGGGFEFDPIQTDLHAIFGYESRNFLGGFRNLRLELKPAVVFYPTRFSTPIEAPTDYLPAERFRAEMRQPGFIEPRTNGLLRGEVNTYPLLLTAERHPPPVIGYFEIKAATGVERTWWKLYTSPTYNLQRNSPFTYVAAGPPDPTLTTILASYVQLLNTLDFRDDRIHPHTGFYALNDFQVAGLGGDATDIREQPDVRGYIPLARKWTLALRGSLGFLFANYADIVKDEAAQASNRAQWSKDSQLLFLRGFFSGGPSSNRGYPLRGVGPHGIIPFYNPGTAFDQLQANCDPTRVLKGQDVSPNCRLPTGGVSLWEASTELRFPIAGPLASAAFCDGSDVTLTVGNPFRHSDTQGGHSFTARDLHLSCGAGARYDTPVGPIRLDIGVRIPGLNPDFTDPKVKATEGDPGTIFGLPVAIAFGIGEAF